MRFIKVDAGNGFHVNMLYKLLQERPSYANINHTKMPTYDEHLEYVRRNPYVAWYLVVMFTDDEYTDVKSLGNTVVIGSVYFTKDNEIGIFVSKEWQGRGWGKRMLEQAERLCMGDRVVANINPENKPSLSLFEKAGYRKISETWVKDIK